MYIKIEIPDEMIEDVLERAAGAIADWGEITYNQSARVVRLYEEDAEEKHIFALDSKKVHSGFAAMLAYNPGAFGRVLIGEANRSDVNLCVQFWCFGEEKYA